MGKLQDKIGNTINGFKLLEVYPVLLPSGKKTGKMLVECQNCGSKIERTGSLKCFEGLKCKCKCKYLIPKKKRFRNVEYEGKSYRITKFCRLYGINVSTFTRRIESGMSVQEAIQKKFECKCEICGKRFISKRPNKKYCSMTCATRKHHGKGAYKTFVTECIYCKQFFITDRGNQRTCSERCRQKASVMIRTQRFNHLKEAGGFDASVTLRDVFKRDNGICQECGNKLNFKCSKLSNKYPSVDHIKPLAKGGTHTWDNVQLLCRGCNIKKSDLYPEAE